MKSNKKMKNTIFVQIASYRDPDIKNTIQNMLDNAKYPNNLVVGICRQYHPDDTFEDVEKWREDDRFKIMDVKYDETKGVCWARNQIQQMYDGEKYTLQIDSHMRFAENWDVEMIKMVKDLQKEGYEKPLLTGYVSSFDPDDDPALRAKDPWMMVFDRFIPEGAVFFKPASIPDWKNLKLPVPGRFYSAHYCFTLGEFSIEVQHNPDYLFHGEEISIGARAYTWGYDIFHPHKPLIFHEYTRKNRTKVWDDDRTWGVKNAKSHLTNRKLFGMDGETQEGHEGKYGFGNIRSLRDYEEYAGMKFSIRGIQKETLDGTYPPNPGIKELGGEEEWLKSFTSLFKHCIDIGHSQVPESDYDFWVVAFHNQHDETIYRQDADKNEINRMINDPDGYCKVWREFQTTKKPDYWVVWPYSKSKGWCDRITGNL
jgi:glycosyltransferase involved in cell wall biosynthesis